MFGRPAAGQGSRREASASDRRAALRPRAGVHALDEEARAVRGEAPLVGYAGGVLTRSARVRGAFRRAVLAARPGAGARRLPLSPESGAALFAADALGLFRNPPR